MPKGERGSRAAPGSTWLTAYEAIKAKILAMDIKPGQIVSENSLSRELGISRTPVREALKRLEQDGLVISHNQRKRVFILTIHEVEEIFDLKVAIESTVARRAAERGDDASRERLRAVVQRMRKFEKAVPSSDVDSCPWIKEWLETDRDFHEILYRMADNKRAEALVENLNYQWHRLRLGILAMEGRIQKAVTEHAALAQAVLDGEPRKAEAAMRDHLENLRKMIVAIMSAFRFPSA